MENGRLLKELREIDTDSRCGVKVELVDGKLDHMTGTIHGARRCARRAQKRPSEACLRPRGVRRALLRPHAPARTGGVLARLLAGCGRVAPRSRAAV